MEGFITFIREQGVVGLAVGFILGGAVSKVVSALVTDIVNPILGVVLGQAKALKSVTLQMGSVELMWGDFVAVLVDFIVIAFVVYYIVRGLGLEKADVKVKK